MQLFFPILMYVVPVAFVLWMLLKMGLSETTCNVRQAKIREMSKTALKSAYVYNLKHESASPEQAAHIRAKIDEYRARVEAIEDEYWREAHMLWVRLSERNLAKSITLYEQEENDRMRDEELGPLDPLAKVA